MTNDTQPETFGEPYEAEADADYRLGRVGALVATYKTPVGDYVWSTFDGSAVPEGTLHSVRSSTGDWLQFAHPVAGEEFLRIELLLRNARAQAMASTVEALSNPEALAKARNWTDVLHNLRAEREHLVAATHRQMEKRGSD